MQIQKEKIIFVENSNQLLTRQSLNYTPVNYTVLQPILLASRKSCHGLGNYYLQFGNHTYSFSLFSHAGNWENGYQQSTQTKQPLHVVVSNPSEHQSGYLPREYSFSAVDGKGVIISTIKKCDDDDAVVLRCYDIEGEDNKFNFTLYDNIRVVEHTNIIEEESNVINSSTNGFNDNIKHHAIETFKIHSNV